MAQSCGPLAMILLGNLLHLLKSWQICPRDLNHRKTHFQRAQVIPPVLPADSQRQRDRQGGEEPLLAQWEDIALQCPPSLQPHPSSQLSLENKTSAQLGNQTTRCPTARIWTYACLISKSNCALSPRKITNNGDFSLETQAKVSCHCHLTGTCYAGRPASVFQIR